MIWFFAATSGLYAGVGQVVEAITLLVAIGPLVLMDVFLDRRTQASTEGLKSRVVRRSPQLRVLFMSASVIAPIPDSLPKRSRRPRSSLRSNDCSRRRHNAS
jgi:Ca2+-transporting ATPase